MNVSPERSLPVIDNDTLGQKLVEAGCLSRTDLSRVMQMEEARVNGSSISKLLIRLGLVSEADMATNLAAMFALPLVKSAEVPEAPLMADKISYRFLKEYQVLPLYLDNDSLVLAMTNPQDEFAVEAIGLAFGCAVERRVGIATELDNAIEKIYGEGQSRMGSILADVDTDEQENEQDIEQLKDMASEAPVIRLVNLIIQRAVEARASDIHIEPFENWLKVRYRIDGVLKEGEAPPVNMSPAVISRLKIMAKLNIAERRLPQDGRVEIRLQGKDLDIRVSTVPTMHGESVVLRLLDRETLELDFDALGFDDYLLAKLNRVLSISHGMLMVTGPTGSGKTTTLYTALNQLNVEQSKLITVEDPVEYQLAGINQIQVKPSIGLNFASALRSIVRQDPDVIMVGEMRDLETARICVQSALTGHVVLSTLHTNDAASSVTRMLEMGVEDYLLTSTVNAVIGQRLVRRLCPHCREAYVPLVEIVEEMGLIALSPDKLIQLYHPRGCDHCGGSGYRGRVAIVEFLEMNDEIRRLVLKHADSGVLHEAAKQDGMRTMYEDGCVKALAGLTSIEEVIRVTQEA